MMYVNVYDVGRSYGGPEEGGWWFDTGTPIACIPVMLTEQERIEVEASCDERMINEWERGPEYRAAEREKARGVADHWREEFPHTGKRSSVLGGDDYDIRIEEEFGRSYPTERPRYE